MLARAKQYQHRLDQLTPYSSAATEPAPPHQTDSSDRANVRIHARPRNRVRSAPAIHYVADVSATSAVSHQKTPKKRSSSGLSHQDMALLDLQDDRTNKQNEQRALEQELGAAEDKASIIEAEISIKEGTVHRLKKDVSDRLKRLERAEAFSRDDPDFDIGKYKQRWRDTKQQYDRAKQDLDASNQELKQISVVIQAKKKRLTRSKQQLIAFDQEIALARFAKIKRNIEQEHVVNAHGEAACENMTLKACKQSALLNAEHNAVEQGSAVMIESLTEIKDFAVSRNEIRSRMRAIIIGKEIVKKGWIGESAYFYDITATVRGQVPPELNPSQHSGAMPRRHLDSSRFRLIIQTTPRYADIVIEGLGRQYTPGIHLEPGRYSIIISAEGYQTVRQQIEMIDSDMTLPIDMRRIANNDRRSSSESVTCKKASAMMDEARMIYSPMKKERLMHTATTICPQNAGFLYELGTMYAKRKQTGDWRKAKRAFEGVLRLDPSYPNAREKLNAINQQQRNGANGAGAAQVLIGIGSLLLQ